MLLEGKFENNDNRSNKFKILFLSYRKKEKEGGRKGRKSTISRNEEGVISCIYTEYRKEAYSKKKISNKIIK